MARPLPDQLGAQLAGLRQSGDGWTARCPAHDDTNPSLSLTVTNDEKVLLRCHAGCEQDAVIAALAALGVEPWMLNGPARDTAEWTPAGPAAAVYDYYDEHRKLLYQVCRTATKDFRQRRPDPLAKSGWVWNLQGVRRVLYRLPELVAALEGGQSVCIAEGEKDVDALVSQGRVATCNSGGAGKWQPEFAGFFTGLDVTIFADKDAAGRAHARAIADTLEGVAGRVWIVEAADPHKDIAAQLGAGLPIAAVKVTRDPTAETVQLGLTLAELLAGSDSDNYDWLIPDLIERGDRLMLSGWEGLGKSMWIRQIAVCAAAGIHPTKLNRMPPINVLVIDCENPRRLNEREYRRVGQQAEREAGAFDQSRWHIEHHPAGIDLATEEDQAWLLERVTAHRPDLLVLGPLYRMHTKNPNDEETARAVTNAIDTARTRVDCAVILEHHCPKGEGGARNRGVAPVGSSLYLRWPEFGLGMKPTADQMDVKKPQTVELLPWRGGRDEREWPDQLRRSEAWPWIPDHGGPHLRLTS